MKLLDAIKSYVFDKDFRFLYNNRFHLHDLMSDEKYIQRIYEIRLGKKLNLQNPQSFNEKLQWLKLYNRDDSFTKMVDKYEVKKFISDIIGEEHVIKTLGLYDSFDEIDLSELPERFVLKTTHDSGSVVICKDKRRFDLYKYKSSLEKSLRRDYYKAWREWPYKNANRRIIAEQYMEQEDGSGLIDYKFFCFDGKPRFFYVSRGLDNHATAEISFYDMDGHELEFHRSDYKPYHNATMPSNMDDMKEIAQRIAQNVNSPFIRIDLYSINGNVYFSEITFAPCSGMIPFEPEEWDLKLGDLITLPVK